MNVYESLFNETTNRIEISEETKMLEKNAFLCSIGGKSKEIDYSIFSELHRKELFVAIHFSAFQRIPDSSEVLRVGAMKDEDIVSYISTSPMFFLRNLKVVNCPYAVKKAPLKEIAFNLFYKVRNSIFLRKLAKKMPNFIQKKIRGAFG